MTTATSGRRARSSGHPRGQLDAVGHGCAEGDGGRPGRGRGPPRRRRHTPSRAPVCVPAGPACHRGGRGRPRRRGRGRGARRDRRRPEPPKTLTLATWGCWAAVDPSGRSSTARTWFSNCEVTAPSIVQWPELWGRVATSLTSSRPPDQKSSTAMTPTPPAISATFWPRAEAASSTSASSRPGTSTSRQTPPTWAVSTAGQAAAVPDGRRATMTASSACEREQLLHHDLTGRRWPSTVAASSRSATGQTPLPS